jgi:hypothetical protein
MWLSISTLDIIWKKSWTRQQYKKIRKVKQKEKEDKRARKAMDSLTVKDQVIRGIVEKCAITLFILVWNGCKGDKWLLPIKLQKHTYEHIHQST